VKLLDLRSAIALFELLPIERKIVTVSPAYVAADAKRNAQLEPLHLTYQENELFWLHSVQRMAITEIDAWDVRSSYGYGGPIANTDDDAFLKRAEQAYCSYCRDYRIVAEFIRLHPMAAAWQVYGGSRSFDRQTVAIELGSDVPRETYSVRARTAVRKAEKAGLKAVELPVDGNVRAFAVFYREAMRVIGADDFYLFNDSYFADLMALPNARLLAVLRADGRWVSAGLFLFGGEMAEYHLSGTMAEGRALGATNLLIDYAASLAKEAGLQALFLGGGTNSAPDNPLFFFKKSFSEAVFPYDIGTRIHIDSLYEELRRIYPSKYRSDRILFYR